MRMRAADALEKICRQHSDWLEAFIDRFPNDLATSTQPSIQWHLVEIQQNHKSTGWSEQGNGDCVRIRTRTAAQSLSPSSCSAGVV